MLKNIAVITQSKFTHRDYKRFGVEFLTKRGFEILVFDFSPMLREPEYVDSTQPGEFADYPGLYSIREIYQFETFLAQMAPAKWYALCFMELLQREIPVFLSLSKFNIKYCNFIIGVLPSIQPFWRRTLSKLYFLFKVQVLHWRIQPADAVFCAGKSARHQLGFKQGINTRIVDVGSFDYSSFVQSYPRLLAEETMEEGLFYPEIIFIDQYLPHHPDNIARQVIEAEEYYSLVNRYLDQISEQLGLTIGISAHPRADYRQNPFEFPLYNIDTMKLIFHARVVVGHYSTALGYAVLMNKPIIQLSFKGMSCTLTYKFIEKLSFELGTELLYIDVEIPSQNGIPPINRNRYKKFIDEYIISDRNIEKPDLLDALYHYLFHQ